MAGLVQSAAGYPSISSELETFCTEIASHIMGQGLVTFDPGNITGQCTSTGPPANSPGPLVNGAGSMGYISGLDGSALADAVHSAVGYPGSTSAELVSFCTAITDYVMDNSEVTYLSGSVTGTCPGGGGPLQAGTAVNGTVS
jgi:hypothetical protein